MSVYNKQESEKSKHYEQLKFLLNKNKNHNNEILKCSSIKEAHIYCKIENLSGQVAGPLIEYYIKCKFCMTKNNASECNGDCKDKNLEDNEIKTSGGGRNHNSYNYVQLRINHNIHNYILTAYHLSKENLINDGEMYIFKVPKKKMITMISKYGGYAHGTVSKLGKITLNDLNDKNNKKEYYIRPKIGNECWKALLYYKINESAL